MKPPVDSLHATCVAIGGRGVMLEGPSGAGKSDLALRLIDRGARLVADDRTLLRAQDGRLFATAPDAIRNRMEIRGVGLVEETAVSSVPVALWVMLDPALPRLPPDPLPGRVHNGCPVPLIALAALEPSAPIKVERALALFGLPS